MVKLMYKNLIVLGIIPSELEHLKQGQPLNISMREHDSNQVIVIIPGDSHEQLEKVAKEAADRLEAMGKSKSQLVLPPSLKGRPN